jgi:hypothetical protein
VSSVIECRNGIAACQARTSSEADNLFLIGQGPCQNGHSIELSCARTNINCGAGQFSRNNFSSAGVRPLLAIQGHQTRPALRAVQCPGVVNGFWRRLSQSEAFASNSILCRGLHRSNGVGRSSFQTFSVRIRKRILFDSMFFVLGTRRDPSHLVCRVSGRRRKHGVHWTSITQRCFHFHENEHPARKTNCKSDVAPVVQYQEIAIRSARKLTATSPARTK